MSRSPNVPRELVGRTASSAAMIAGASRTGSTYGRPSLGIPQLAATRHPSRNPASSGHELIDFEQHGPLAAASAAADRLMVQRLQSTASTRRPRAERQADAPSTPTGRRLAAIQASPVAPGRRPARVPVQCVHAGPDRRLGARGVRKPGSIDCCTGCRDAHGRGRGKADAPVTQGDLPSSKHGLSPTQTKGRSLGSRPFVLSCAGPLCGRARDPEACRVPQRGTHYWPAAIRPALVRPRQ